jgi:hypothetical protein
MVPSCEAHRFRSRGLTMNRTAALLTIALLSSLATPLVVQATTPAPREPVAAPASVQASVQTAAVETLPAAEPACVRKVKVVYAGYGEGAARGCVGQTAAK